MAILKSELNKQVTLSERDYLELIEDHIILNALKAAGVEKLPIYKVARSILKDGRIEVHVKSVKHFYK